VAEAAEAAGAKRGRPNAAAAPTPVANSRRRVGWCWCSGIESEAGMERASYRKVHFWLLPPLQVHSCSGVPLAVPAPVASRQSPDLLPVMVSLGCTVHCWFCWPLHDLCHRMTHPLRTCAPFTAHAVRQAHGLPRRDGMCTRAVGPRG